MAAERIVALETWSVPDLLAREGIDTKWSYNALSERKKNGIAIIGSVPNQKSFEKIK
jgi:hypothetical protein